MQGSRINLGQLGETERESKCPAFMLPQYFIYSHSVCSSSISLDGLETITHNSKRQKCDQS